MDLKPCRWLHSHICFIYEHFYNWATCSLETGGSENENVPVYINNMLHHNDMQTAE